MGGKRKGAWGGSALHCGAGKQYSWEKGRKRGKARQCSAAWTLPTLFVPLLKKIRRRNKKKIDCLLLSLDTFFGMICRDRPTASRPLRSITLEQQRQETWMSSIVVGQIRDQECLRVRLLCFSLSFPFSNTNIGTFTHLETHQKVILSFLFLTFFSLPLLSHSTPSTHLSLGNATGERKPHMQKNRIERQKNLLCLLCRRTRQCMHEKCIPQ